MIRLHKHLLTVGLLAGLAVSAIAQTPAPAANPARPEAQQHAHRGAGPMDPARMQERRARMEKGMAERMEFFKFKLKVTPSQEGAWNSWTTAMKPAARPQRPDRAEFARLSTPERIDRMRAMRTARQAEMDRKMDATKSFYTVLNADQKKVFDEASLKMLQRRGGGRGGFGGGQHHRG